MNYLFSEHTNLSRWEPRLWIFQFHNLLGGCKSFGLIWFGMNLRSWKCKTWLVGILPYHIMTVAVVYSLVPYDLEHKVCVVAVVFGTMSHLQNALKKFHCCIIHSVFCVIGMWWYPKITEVLAESSELRWECHRRDVLVVQDECRYSDIYLDSPASDKNILENI